MQVPARFDYEVAGSVDEAIELLRRHGPEAYLMAGGHSLVPMMKLRLASPEVVIGIHRLDDDLRYIDDEGGVLRIGALARHRDVGESAVIREHYTLLADAEKLIADPLVRNMGTVGGALAHADPAEDLPAAFTALGCEVVVRGPNGERTIDVDDLYLGPFETSIESDEIMTEVRVPSAPDGSSYFKMERRAGDYASASVGVALSMAMGRYGTSALACAAWGARRSGPRRPRPPSRARAPTLLFTSGQGKPPPRSAIPPRTPAARSRTSGTW